MGIKMHVATKLIELSPVDYAIWSVIQQRVYETRVHDIDELRHLLHVWHGLEQSLIDDAVDQWPACLCVYVHANGIHFEHPVCLSICFSVGLLEFYALHRT